MGWRPRRDCRGLPPAGAPPFPESDLRLGGRPPLPLRSRSSSHPNIKHPGTRAPRHPGTASPGHRRWGWRRARAVQEPGRDLPSAKARTGGHWRRLPGRCPPQLPVPSAALSRRPRPSLGSLGHIPGVRSGALGRTHSLGRPAAAAAAPWGRLALLQAQLATPVRGCTGLIKQSARRARNPRFSSQQRRPHRPPLPRHPHPSSAAPSPLHSLCAWRPGPTRP